MEDIIYCVSYREFDFVNEKTNSRVTSIAFNCFDSNPYTFKFNVSIRIISNYSIRRISEQQFSADLISTVSASVATSLSVITIRSHSEIISVRAGVIIICRVTVTMSGKSMNIIPHSDGCSVLDN